MKLRPEFTLLPSSFDSFLLASIGEEKSGRTLTVLSALARLGFDPWKEASRLAGLSKDAAARALAVAIAVLPEGDWKTSDSPAIATRLVAALPRCQATAAGRPELQRSTRRNTAKRWMMLFLIVVAAAAIEFFYRVQ